MRADGNKNKDQIKKLDAEMKKSSGLVREATKNVNKAYKAKNVELTKEAMAESKQREQVRQSQAAEA